MGVILLSRLFMSLSYLCEFSMARFAAYTWSNLLHSMVTVSAINQFPRDLQKNTSDEGLGVEWDFTSASVLPERCNDMISYCRGSRLLDWAAKDDRSTKGSRPREAHAKREAFEERRSCDEEISILDMLQDDAAVRSSDRANNNPRSIKFGSPRLNRFERFSCIDTTVKPDNMARRSHVRHEEDLKFRSDFRACFKEFPLEKAFDRRVTTFEIQGALPELCRSSYDILESLLVAASNPEVQKNNMPEPVDLQQDDTPWPTRSDGTGIAELAVSSTPRHSAAGPEFERALRRIELVDAPCPDLDAEPTSRKNSSRLSRSLTTFAAATWARKATEKLRNSTRSTTTGKTRPGDENKRTIHRSTVKRVSRIGRPPESSEAHTWQPYIAPTTGSAQSSSTGVERDLPNRGLMEHQTEPHVLVLRPTDTEVDDWGFEQYVAPSSRFGDAKEMVVGRCNIFLADSEE
jgi:hypothetical protein